MPEDPTQAGEPRTQGVTRAYDDGRISVLWDATRCIHTAICLKRLPAVFNTQVRPWIDLSAAEAEEIAATVRACPTGALRYEAGEVRPEEAHTPTMVEVRPNGPLLVRGHLRVQGPGGSAARDELRVALCRCGASENKPYCDNSHRLTGFRDQGLR